MAIPIATPIAAGCTTIVDLVRRRAAANPEQEAFAFLPDSGSAPRILTYAELDRQARNVAGWLQEHALYNERVLLAQPQGLEYIVALLGCLYAGSVAVPAYPAKLNRHLQRLSLIVKDAAPRVALASKGMLARVRTAAAHAPELQQVQWCAVEEIHECAATDWAPPALADEQLALLQYTSGSTGDPRGVMITHGNLSANQKMIQAAFGVTEDSVIAGWLPLYHDMGLIGNILQPLWSGARCVLMSPMAFLQRPASWLRLIGEYRATISGGPNFAYELCCQKVTAEEQRDLDLSSWRVAFNGSEPVRAETMARFTRKFTENRFHAAAWQPCYGLAEATLFVSGARQAAPSAGAADSSEVELPSHANNGALAVSCGLPASGQKIVIADPETLRACRPGEVGEILLAGPNVARGYWRRPQATQEIFKVFLKNHREPFLRTGDLGFLNTEKKLVITGRIKDLIIIRGCNLYPQDLEYAVQRAHPAFAKGPSAAFCIEVEGTPELVILQEVVSTSKNFDGPGLLETANSALAQEHGVRAFALCLVRAGTLPTTTSGKIRRQECKRQFLAGELKVLAANRAHVRPARMDRLAGDSPVTDNAHADAESAAVRDDFRAIAAQVLCLPVEELQSEKPLTAFGLDSLQVAELKAKIAGKWGVELPWEALVTSPTLAALSASILAGLRSANPLVGLQRVDRKEDLPFALSFGQRALWFIYKLAPANAAYNIPAAFRVCGALDLEKLQASFRLLVQRHPSLRTVFASGENGPVQQVLSPGETVVTVVPAEAWTEEDVAKEIKASATRPFVLEQAPLFRTTLFTRSRRESILLFVIHHIITDFASLMVLFSELQSIYASLEAGMGPPPLPRLGYEYCDFVAWQQNMLMGKRGDDLRSYWHEHLAGELPVLKLPLDNPRPPVQTYSGATHTFKINPDLSGHLLALARQAEVSFYTLLITAFVTLLHRYTFQPVIVIGTPVSGRTLAGLKGITGYFINQVVLRASFADGQPWSSLLEQMRHTVACAIANQDYPLALVADEIHPEWNPGYSRLFQTMFSFQQAGPGHVEELAGAAVNAGGYGFAVGSLQLESVSIDHGGAPLDLTLSLAQIRESLVGLMQYNSALFDRSTMARMAGHFQVLLQSIVDGFHHPIPQLDLLAAHERTQLLYDWNDTAVPYGCGPLLPEMLAQQAARSGAKIALVSSQGELTYWELESRANQLARYLVSLGAAADRRIALCLERSLEMLIALLGILKAGAAYLPVDPSHPEERIEYLLHDAQPMLAITSSSHAGNFGKHGVKVICLDMEEEIKKQETSPPQISVQAENLAYVIYTSASTGKPKGVMISHRSLANFMLGMDRVLDCGPQDIFLATTSVAFDISVLELLWTLTRGARVVLAPEMLPVPAPMSRSIASAEKKLDYSLSYFASADERVADGKYRLLLEGAKYADDSGLAAVWTPERHFHRFGGLYPNPAVIGAALAAITRRIQLRAGSVVLPLHNVLRVAEEWSVVDNLSGGRTGIAFASGWHADDFALAPQNYPERKELTFRSIEIFTRLWRGETVTVQSGSGKEIEIRVFPQPVQKQPPLWVTAAGARDTFIRAGQIGANVLTHLLGQTLEELREKIKVYRESRAQSGYSPESGRVTLMLHTFIGNDLGRVKDTVRGPFMQYLRSALDLVRKLVVSANLPVDLNNMSSADMDALLTYAFDRYFGTSALFGTTRSCAPMIADLKQIGVDEVACLIDFGIETESVLEGMRGIGELREREQALAFPASRKTLKQLIEEQKPTLMQCTPTMLNAIRAVHGDGALQSLRALLLGGEPLPPALAKNIQQLLPCRLINMYGPTETTIWSSTDEVRNQENVITVGRPLANTQLYVLDPWRLSPVPPGVIGELHVGGDGLARGYFNRPALTAEKFIPDPFSGCAGRRLYCTGDMARYLEDGRVVLLGRNDSQIKIRGVRIELGEIESALTEHEKVKQAVVLAREDAAADKRLKAYVVAMEKDPPSPAELRSFLKSKLPEVMVPSEYCFLAALPVNANGKLNRQALPIHDQAPESSSAIRTVPLSEYEVMIADIWKQVLAVETPGIDDNFFDLGGHSLRMVQVQGQLSSRLGTELPLTDLLEYPTIRSLALRLADQEKARPVARAKDERALKQRQAFLRQKNIFSSPKRSIQ
jgi:natural product biosynthesis luciferase-like monooxygenase protein